MARWRDVKNGKLSLRNKKVKTDEIQMIATPLSQRFKAFVTDSFMILMPLMYIVFYFIMGSREAFADDKISGWLYILVPHMIAVISFWYFKSQTPGMRAYELEIISTSANKSPSLIQLFIRYVSMTVLMFLIFPIFYPYINKTKKTIWDLLSQTYIKQLNNEL